MNTIYMLENKINGKKYVGKTIRPLRDRVSEHFGSARDGTGGPLHTAIRKYGEENFIIFELYHTITESDLGDAEIFFIKEMDCCLLDGPDKGYNLTRGGDGFSSETGKLARQKHKPNYQNPWSGDKGSRMSSENNKKRVINGKNPWAGVKGSENAKRVAANQIKEGRHPFQGEKAKAKAKLRIQKQFENGTHINQLTHLCPHCAVSGVGRNMFRWHFKNCKKNPSSSRFTHVG